jgi:hypothetical protein
MKWYMAALQGGAQRYMDVNAQERAYAAEQALRDLEIAKNSEAANKKNSLKLGSLTFNWRDPSDISGGDWQEKKARLDDYKGFLKENFYTNNKFDETKWNAFKAEDGGVGADAVIDEWKSGLEAWLYPNPSVVEGVGTQTFNTYDYEWAKDWSELYDAATAIDKPRDTGSYTGVTQYEKNGEIINVEELFDVVDNLEKTTAPEDAVVRPDHAIHFNVENEKSMLNIMKSVFRNQQYSGQKFTNDAEYYRFMKENPHHLFIGNALWNHHNQREGWDKNRTYEEIAQIAIYYNRTHDEVLDSMNLMTPKFKVGGHGTSQRTVTENRKVSNSEVAKANAAVEANDRAMFLANKLQDYYRNTNFSGGAALSIFNAMEGIFGETGQINQIGSLLKTYDELADDKIGGIEKGDGIFKNKLLDLQQEYQNASANGTRVSDAAAIRYLEITLAFNLALAEQGGGGGRAISDQDFEYALQRVGKGKWTSVEQSIAKLDVLKQIATKDFIAAKIKSSEKYSQTHSALAEHWMKYKESFETVKQSYITQLKGNYVFGEIRETDGSIKDSYFVDTEDGIKQVPYIYNGRLSALMAYDYGKRPDVDIRDSIAQGLWSNMTDAEKILIRPNEAALENMDNLMLGSGYDSKQDTLNEIAEKAQEENNQIEFAKDIYADPAWWGNADTWPQKIESIKNEKVLTQRDFLQQFDNLLQGDLNTVMGNAPAIKEIMFKWKESQKKEDNKKDVNDAYMGILGNLRSPMFSQQYNMIKENYAQIINLIQSIGYMDDALIREGPRQNQ